MVFYKGKISSLTSKTVEDIKSLYKYLVNLDIDIQNLFKLAAPYYSTVTGMTASDITVTGNIDGGTASFTNLQCDTGGLSATNLQCNSGSLSVTNLSSTNISSTNLTASTSTITGLLVTGISTTNISSTGISSTDLTASTVTFSSLLSTTISMTHLGFIGSITALGNIGITTTFTNAAGVILTISGGIVTGIT